MHHHWEGEKTVMCRNDFDWDCSSSAHSFQIGDGSLSGHGSLCGFTFSRTDDASSIENLMLFDKVESEVWELERDVQITSALLKVEKKKRLKDSTLSLSVVKPDCFMWHLLEQARSKRKMTGGGLSEWPTWTPPASVPRLKHTSC